jgi:ribosomal-protein-alanine N-acetyltransferase
LPTALTTRRIRLAPVTAGDIDVLWTIWRGADVRRYLFDDIDVTRERVEEIVRTIVLPSQVRKLGIWLARMQASAVVIGTVGLLPVTTSALYAPRLQGEIEALAAFDPSAWGNGYATETLEALIDYAFRDLGLVRLAAVVDVPNEASHRLVARLGFAVSGEFLGPRYPFRTYVLTAASSIRRRAGD